MTADQPGVRVLVIEDDSDTREMMTEALRVEGHDVSTASNGADGLQQAIRLRPDVILLDLMMPVMDGFQFRKRQRGHPDIAAIPVVVVSALGIHPDLDGTVYVGKPCSVDDVLDVVSRLAGTGAE